LRRTGSRHPQGGHRVSPTSVSTPSTAAEERGDPQRNLIGILYGLAICTLIYVIVGFVLTGMVPYIWPPTAGARSVSASRRSVGSSRSARSPMSAVLLGSSTAAAHLLRDGPRRAVPEGPLTSTRHESPVDDTIITGVFVAAWAIVGAGETTT
jgi:APA family basic amino acid/polyamine antiporter